MMCNVGVGYGPGFDPVQLLSPSLVVSIRVPRKDQLRWVTFIYLFITENRLTQLFCIIVWTRMAVTDGKTAREDRQILKAHSGILMLGEA